MEETQIQATVVAQVNYEHNMNMLAQLSGRQGLAIERRPTESYYVLRRYGVAVNADWLTLFPLHFQSLLQTAMDRAAEYRSRATQQARRVVKPVAESAITEFRFKREIKGLPRCTICMEEFKSNEKVWRLHGEQCSYHKRCLSKWFKHSSTCPNCGLDCA